MAGYRENLEYINKLIFVKAYDNAFQKLLTLVSSKDASSDMTAILRLVELGVKLNRVFDVENVLKATVDYRTESLNLLSKIILNQHSALEGVQSSIEELQKHLKQFGASAVCYFSLGYAYECLGNTDRAIFNYELSIKHDAAWFPGYFGLSQQYYFKHQEELGDYYFYLFEKHAPFNLYGNFETHRNLCQHFIDREEFEYAKSAITTLGEWWIDNKGSCPVEVRIYEQFALSRIASLQGEEELASSEKLQAQNLAKLMLKDSSADDNASYFAGKVLEEFGEFELALDFYHKIIAASKNLVIVQKLVGHLIQLEEFQKASEFIAEAHENHPDNKDLEFLTLVARLRADKLDVNEYMQRREKAVELSERNGSKGELLSVLSALMVEFDKDALIHSLLGDLYLNFSQFDRAHYHFENMYLLEKFNPSIVLKWTNFLIGQKKIEQAQVVLEKIDISRFPQHRDEILWAKVNLFLQTGKYSEASIILDGLLQQDPWNVTYNIHFTILGQMDNKLPKDSLLEKLASGVSDSLDLPGFQRYSSEVDQERYPNIHYLRAKIKYLYSNGSHEALQGVVKAATKSDPKRATRDLLKLLNTNFDSEAVYFALAELYKDMWQLEAASVWLEQALLTPNVALDSQKRAWTELADCYLWQGIHLERALQYAKSGGEGISQKRQATVLAHAYLKLGRVREAKQFLDVVQENDHEVLYFKGLIEYRNGSRERANALWKPLLTLRSESLRMHHIKQMVLKFYFEGSPYLKAN